MIKTNEAPHSPSTSALPAPSTPTAENRKAFSKQNKFSAVFTLGGFLLGGISIFAAFTNLIWIIGVVVGAAAAITGIRWANQAKHGYRQLYLYPAMDAAFGVGSVIYGGKSMPEETLLATGLFHKQKRNEAKLQMSLTYQSLSVKIYNLHTYNEESRGHGEDSFTARITRFSGLGFAMQAPQKAPCRIILAHDRFTDAADLGDGKLKPVNLRNDKRFREFTFYCLDEAQKDTATAYLTEQRMELLRQISKELSGRCFAFEWENNRLFLALEGDRLDILSDTSLVLGDADKHFTVMAEKAMRAAYTPVGILARFFYSEQN